MVKNLNEQEKKDLMNEPDYTELIGFCAGCGREVDCSVWDGDCTKCEPQEDEVFEKRLREFRERRERETNIFCPFCEHKQDTDTLYHYVSYWGEDVKSCDCESCNKKFFVTEHVDRTFSTSTKELEWRT